MDYKELTKRYLNAETSLEEEAMLKAHRTDSAEAEQRAVEAMIYLHQKERIQPLEVKVKLHEPQTQSRWQIIFATAVASVALLWGVSLLNEPTIYGYYNGEPITSLAKAESLTHEMFSNMTLAEAETENIFNDLFLIQ